MNCKYVNDLVGKGAKLIDVRTEREFLSGNIQESTNIPLERFHSIEDKLSVEDTILLYCRSGTRSEIAKNHLVSLGYNAINVGGISQYVGCVK